MQRFSTASMSICKLSLTLLFLVFVAETFASRLETCALDPEVPDGPYYVNLQLLRSDIRENHDGIPLYLEIVVINSNNCQQLAGAGVEIWHCDAAGIYSHFQEASLNVPNARPDDSTYLRGSLMSDSNGAVNFTTIYPGWTRDRAVHIGLKIHQRGSGAVIHTGQLFFEDTLTDAIAAQSEYSSAIANRLSNADDTVYNDGGSSGLVTSWSYVSPGDIKQGIKASVRVNVDAKVASSPTPDPLFSGSVTPSRSPTPSKSRNLHQSTSASRSAFPTATPIIPGVHADLSPADYGYESSGSSFVFLSLATLVVLFLTL